MKLQKNQKLLFIGDSITDAGRVQPGPAEGLFDPLGRGYVTLVNALLGAVYPQLATRIVNAGTSGNTVRELAGRWQKDVIDQKPQWLSIMIGINDVWRQFDSPVQTEWHVGPEEYERTLAGLVERTRPQVAGMVLMSPYYIEPNGQDPMRARMDRYTSIVRKLAGKHDAIFVDTQGAFDEALKHYHPMWLAWDRVHPNQVGHMIIARAFLQGLGFEWNAK